MRWIVRRKIYAVTAPPQLLARADGEGLRNVDHKAPSGGACWPAKKDCLLLWRDWTIDLGAFCHGGTLSPNEKELSDRWRERAWIEMELFS